jgi:S-(hydroxymethyl)mycothiol dehydrogenase
VTIGSGVVARHAGEPAAVEQIEIPDPGPGEARVRLLASGVCHSDLHYQEGSLGDDYPFLLGHEGAGIIEAVGAGVPAERLGEYVALTYRAPCGRCAACRVGRFDSCPVPASARTPMRTRDGVNLTPALWLGTFATHTLVDAAQAIPIPEDCPPDRACLLGCGVLTGIGSVLNTAGVRPGQSVAVFGCGGVGASVIMGARIAHAGRIIGVDINASKLESARQLGATDVVNASRDDPVVAIRELTGGVGVDASFEAIGLPRTLEQAVWSLGYKGVAVLIGFPAPGATLNLDLQRFFFGGSTVRVSLNGDAVPARDMPLLAAWYTRGELDLDHLVSRRIDLAGVQDAFAAMEAGDALRSVIVFDPDSRS